MAQVTLRDLTTNEDIVVPPEGYIFGRVGGDADIQLEDNSISRRQARVSLKGGMWLLETLAVPQGARAPRPVQLQEGASFAVGQSEFEVVQIEAEDEPEADPAARTFAPQKGKPGPPPAAAPAKKAPAPANAKTAPAASAQKRSTTAGAPAAEEEAPAKGIGAMFVGVPKGIAYYLVNVPKLLVNPQGTVRKQIEELPAEPMGKIELIGYALPSLFISLLLPSIATGIGLLIGPTHTFSFSAFVPIVPAISAVIGAVITGFIFHPVLGWVITKLKGNSDARSRSNYFLQLMTLGIILAVPQALSIILAMVPIPFISLLGPLLTVVGSMVSLYVVYQWLVRFDVVKWMLMVVKVLAVLTLLGAGWGLVQGVIASVKSLGSGGGSSATVAAGDGESELGEMPTDPAEAAEWSKKKQAELMAKAAEAQKQALAAAGDAKDDADEAVKTVKKDAPPEPKKGDPKPEPRAEPKADPEPVAVKDTPPPPAKDVPAAKDEPAASPSGGYATFAKRRDAIEKLFENDPTVLQKNAELQRLYGDYIESAYDLDKKWGKETSKKPERAKLNAHLRDAELYGKTGKTIDTLAGKLGVR